MRSVVGGVCAFALVAGASMAVAGQAQAAPSGGSATHPHATHSNQGPLAKANHARPASHRVRANRTVSRAAEGQAAGTFVSLSPSRILDTRSKLGAPGGNPGQGQTVHLQVTGKGGVPTSGVAAVVLNVTVANATAGGFVTVYADGAKQPTASNVNFVAGRAVPNLVVAPVNPTTGKVALYHGGKGVAPLIADVAGYYVSGTPAVNGSFKSLAPTRLLDTRSKVGGSTPASRGTVTLAVGGRGGVPASGVSAVILNVTVTGATGSGFVNVYAAGGTRPASSNLNFSRGQTLANLVVAPVSSTGKVALYNGSTGSTQLIADVAGYFKSGTATVPGAFTVLPPVRVLDTRTNLGSNRPIAKDTAYVEVDNDGNVNSGVPTSDVSAVVMNVTATNTTAPGYVTVFNPNDDQPTASNLNFVKGQTVPNLTFAPVGGGSVALYNGAAAPIDLLGDVAGYYLGNEGSISGTVTAASDGTSPLNNVDVSVYPNDTDGQRYFTSSDTDGTYSVTGIQAGSYTICFQASSGNPDDGGAGGPSATGYAPVCVDKTITGGTDLPVDEALNDGGAITGTVTGADAPGGLGDVEVDVEQVDGNGFVGYGYVSTNPDGTYTIDSLGTGSYQVCFYGGDGTGGDSDGGYENDRCLDDPVSVTEGKTTKSADVELEPRGALSGTVTFASASNNDYLDYDVSVFDEDGNEVYGTSFYGADATYRVGGLPQGDYRVCIDDAYDEDTNSSYASQCYDGVAWDGNTDNLPDGATAVDVTTGNNHQNVDFQLEQEG